MTDALTPENRALIEREWPHWLKDRNAGYWAVKPRALERLLNAARTEEVERLREQRNGMAKAFAKSTEDAATLLAQRDALLEAIEPFARQAEGLSPRSVGGWMRDSAGRRERVLEIIYSDLTPFIRAKQACDTAKGDGT